MAESIQRILVGRTLAGQHPDSPTPLMEWLEAVARGWNARPTPFIWGVSGRSARQRTRERRYGLGGSGAVSRQPIPHQEVAINGDQQGK